MSAINVPGRVWLHRVRSITSPPTGRKSTSTVTSNRQAASFRLMATKATASCMTLEGMGHPASVRQPAGHTGDATSTISGPRINPRSRARLSTVSARFTTSNVRLWVSLPISASPRVKSTARQKSKPCASGPRRS